MAKRKSGTIINVAGMLAFSGPATLEKLPLRRAVYRAALAYLDPSKVPRMSPEDVVTASLQGLSLREVVCAPGVEKSDLLDAVFSADLAAFDAQSPALAARYKA